MNRETERERIDEAEAKRLRQEEREQRKVRSRLPSLVEIILQRFRLFLSRAY